MTDAIDDIEIYARNLTLAAIMQWLDARFDQVTLVNQGRQVHDLTVTGQTRQISVMITEKASGKAWSSIWFKQKPGPWPNDLACAQDLNRYHQCQVRFNASPWQQGDNMDEWCHLDEQGNSQLVDWPNS